MSALKRTVFALTLAGAAAALVLPASAEEQVPPPRHKWSFAGPFGKYDEGQLQRELHGNGKRVAVGG